MATPSNQRTAFITGAVQGIGKGIALRLARDGYNVAINDLASKEDQATATLEEIKKITATTGASASLHFGDVSVEQDVIEMIEGVVRDNGSLDVLVANAAVVQWTTLVDTPVEEADKILAVNVRGVFLCYKYAAKQMIAQGRGGRIIGASSVVGKQAMAREPIYSASKFAVRGLTQASAKELGRHKITVNGYAPGCIPGTDMINYVDEKARGLGFATVPGELSAKYATGSALGHNGTYEDVAGLVAYLASPESSFITGQTITVDGGVVYD